MVVAPPPVDDPITCPPVVGRGRVVVEGTDLDDVVATSDATGVLGAGALVRRCQFQCDQMARPPLRLSVELGAGADTFDGVRREWVAATVYGGDGDDTLRGGDSDDCQRGSHRMIPWMECEPNEESTCDGGQDVLWGGDGDDVLLAGGKAARDDVIEAWTGDALYGEAGADTLVGAAQDELLDGGPGADVISGLGGADTLLGGAGADQLCGGRDHDALLGGRGNDVLTSAREQPDPNGARQWGDLEAWQQPARLVLDDDVALAAVADGDVDPASPNRVFRQDAVWVSAADGRIGLLEFDLSAVDAPIARAHLELYAVADASNETPIHQDAEWVDAAAIEGLTWSVLDATDTVPFDRLGHFVRGAGQETSRVYATAAASPADAALLEEVRRRGSHLVLALFAPDIEFFGALDGGAGLDACVTPASPRCEVPITTEPACVPDDPAEAP